VADADILVENYRAGVMEQFDLGYEDVRAYNPDIVYVSGTGYGGSGPYADRPGQDLLAQAITALPTYTGRSDDPPTPAGTMVCDGHSAMNLALYTLMALFHRERTGEGQRVEVNLLSAGVDLQCAEITTELNLDADFERSEAGVGHIAAPGPYGIHATADGHVAVSFANLSNLADEFDLDPVCDYDDQPACYEYRDEIQRQVGAALADESTDLVMKRLLDVGVWVAEVNDYQDVIEDPQVEHNDMIVELDHPELGKFEVTGVPARLSATEPVMAPPPLLGEHTEEILQARDYEDGDIETLREDGAIPEAGD
jgi:crotonobetainyl-CoA:carnitine CoA-transferase CaiB-like acyl-CoA transferase